MFGKVQFTLNTGSDGETSEMNGSVKYPVHSQKQDNEFASSQSLGTQRGSYWR